MVMIAFDWLIPVLYTDLSWTYIMLMLMLFCMLSLFPTETCHISDVAQRPLEAA